MLILPKFDKNSKKWFVNPILKAIKRYKMFENGDKIGIGLSGGVDSTTLLYILTYIKKFTHLKFDIAAVHIDMFGSKDIDKMEQYCDKLGVQFKVFKPKLKPIKDEKSICAICSKIKRGILSENLQNMGVKKVVFAHHADDIAETFFMNMFINRKLGSFSPKVGIKTSDMEIIRPLIYIEKSTLERIFKKYNLPIFNIGCIYEKSNVRESYRDFLNIAKERLNIKGGALSVVKSLENIDQTNIYSNLW